MLSAVRQAVFYDRGLVRTVESFLIRGPILLPAFGGFCLLAFFVRRAFGLISWDCLSLLSLVASTILA
jgi:hypothetical protein